MREKQEKVDQWIQSMHKRQVGPGEARRSTQEYEGEGEGRGGVLLHLAGLCGCQKEWSIPSLRLAEAQGLNV